MHFKQPSVVMAIYNKQKLYRLHKINKQSLLRLDQLSLFALKAPERMQFLECNLYVLRYNLCTPLHVQPMHTCTPSECNGVHWLHVQGSCILEVETRRNALPRFYI